MLTESEKQVITFTKPSYILFDKTLGGVRTTHVGQLAIFTTKSVASIAVELLRERSNSQLELSLIEIVPVMIVPIIDADNEGEN